MKKAFVIILIALAALSAVAIWLKPRRASEGKTVLSYACVEFWAKREQVALFEKLNPRYEVKIDVGNTEAEKVIVQSLAGVGPDLFNAYSASMAAAFVNAGIAWDITDEMKAAGIDVAGETWPATHSFTIRDGRVYGFPYAAHTDALFYNKAIFDSLGIPYPASPLTRDAFLDLARKLTVRDANGRVKHYGFIFRRDIHWLDMVRQWGGRVYSRDGTRCELDSPGNVAAVQFLCDLVWKYRVSPSPAEETSMATTGGWGSGLVTLFGGGHAAMTLGGRYFLVMYRQKAQYPNLRLGIADYQFGPNPGHAGYAGCVMINRSSPLREHALAYLKYMAGAPYNELVNSQADGMAPVRRFAATEAFLHNPAHPEEDQNDIWRQVLETSVPEEVSPFVNGGLAGRIISEQLDMAFANQKTAAEALQSAAAQINAAIEKNVARNKTLKARYDSARQVTSPSTTVPTRSPTERNSFAVPPGTESGSAPGARRENDLTTNKENAQ